MKDYSLRVLAPLLWAIGGIAFFASSMFYALSIMSLADGSNERLALAHKQYMSSIIKVLKQNGE